MSVYVAGLENVLVKTVGLGSPSLSLSLAAIVTEPPGANIPPVSNEPLDKAAVVKPTLPKSSPVIMPPPFSPLTRKGTDPVRASPLSEPVSVPPLLRKSTEPAIDAAGRARCQDSEQKNFSSWNPPREGFFATG